MESAPEYWFPTSHFGSGIITWTLPWLFRTPEGYNLLARGPANYPKDGISPLEGLVETDWAVSTFTMNWKITRPDEWITFEEGEPICMVVPQRRDELEEFSPEVSSIESDPELAASFEKWCESRDQFNDARKDPESEAAKKGWEKHYVKGTAPDGSVASEHRTKMRLKGFAKHE